MWKNSQQNINEGSESSLLRTRAYVEQFVLCSKPAVPKIDGAAQSDPVAVALLTDTLYYICTVNASNLINFEIHLKLNSVQL